MAQHRSVPCPATAMAGQLAGITAVLAAGAVNAHMSGIAAARQAREVSASHILAGQVDEAVDAAHQWAAYAQQQAIEIERLRGEVARLQKALAVRQTYIDRINGRKAA